MSEGVPVSIRSSKDASRIVHLTDAAVSKVAEFLTAEPEGTVLRFAARPGGCSGFRYELVFVSQANPDDEREDFAEGVSVVVDPESVPLIGGSTIDYQETLQGQGFRIENPNTTRSCGCGDSFG